MPLRGDIRNLRPTCLQIRGFWRICNHLQFSYIHVTHLKHHTIRRVKRWFTTRCGDVYDASQRLKQRVIILKRRVVLNKITRNFISRYIFRLFTPPVIVFASLDAAKNHLKTRKHKVSIPSDLLTLWQLLRFWLLILVGMSSPKGDSRYNTP